MPAFLLTWKEIWWPHENIVRMVREVQTKGYVDEPWRIRSHRKAQPGDRVWVLRQGPGPKGIFGAGHIMAPPSPGIAANGETRWMVPVRFEDLMDPMQKLLIGEDATVGVLGEKIGARASGDPIEDEQSAALEKFLTTSRLGRNGDWTKRARRDGVEGVRRATAPVPSTTRRGIMHMRSWRAYTYAMEVVGAARPSFKVGWAFDLIMRARQFNQAAMPSIGGLRYEPRLHKNGIPRGRLVAWNRNCWVNLRRSATSRITRSCMTWPTMTL
jgi:hypothetical protein